MRKDWDYVEFGDYQKDMDELAQTGAAIVTSLREENRDMRRVICAIIAASGGRVRVPFELVHELGYELTVEMNRADRVVEYSIRRKRPAALES